MLTFNEYKNKIEKYDRTIEELKLRILYRKIELVGPLESFKETNNFDITTSTIATSACCTYGTINIANNESCCKDTILKNDKLLSDLKLTLDAVQHEREYIKYRAEVPTYIYSINNEELWPKEDK